MINLKYKFKSIEQVGNQIVATYEIEQPDRYQIASEVYQEWLADDKAHDPYSIAGGVGTRISYVDWLDQQQAEEEE